MRFKKAAQMKRKSFGQDLNTEIVLRIVGKQMDVSDWAAAFEGKNVQQIVGFCGNGKLTNGSDCSKEFCGFLEEQNEAKLAEHANYCLENSFEKSGYVLQDVVNEIGRRIGYDVENGLYSGKKGAAGFDGLAIPGRGRACGAHRAAGGGRGCGHAARAGVHLRPPSHLGHPGGRGGDLGFVDPAAALGGHRLGRGHSVRALLRAGGAKEDVLAEPRHETRGASGGQVRRIVGPVGHLLVPRR